MAIKGLDTPQNLVIDVHLKSGEKYEACDITDQPFGEHERQVAFWWKGRIRSYPLNDVEFCELYETDDLSVSNVEGVQIDD